jgi:hypothetical protein
LIALEIYMKILSIGLIVSTLIFPCLSHAAEFVPTDGTTRTFEIRSDESESDTLLRATCVAGGRVDLRLGATFQIGRGKLEPVTVSLTAGNRTTILKGISVESPDIEMTGGTELLTTLPSDHRAFNILAQAGSIRIKATGGETNRFQLGQRATTGLKTFLDTCRAAPN